MMKKLLLLMAMPLALSACDPTAAVNSAPAPLAKTTIDDRALMVAWQTADVLLDGVNLLIDAKVIKPGTPRALNLANAIDRLIKALDAAENAVKAGSTTNYAVAIAAANAAITDARVAIKG